MTAFHGLLPSLGIFLFIIQWQHNGPFVHMFGPIVKNCQSNNIKYQGRRITYMYYSNSVCTFQLSLLNAGDINPNPGPATKNRKRHLFKHFYSIVGLSQHQMNGRISYDSNYTLLKFQDFNNHLQSSVWTIIKSLGLNRKPKTQRVCKGGKRRRNLNQTRPQIDSQQENQVRPLNSKFSLWNARSVRSKIPIICDLIISN